MTVVDGVENRERDQSVFQAPCGRVRARPSKGRRKGLTSLPIQLGIRTDLTITNLMIVVYSSDNFPLRGDHGRVMGEAVEQRRCELFVAGKHGYPFGKRVIGRHDR